MLRNWKVKWTLLALLVLVLGASFLYGIGLYRDAQPDAEVARLVEVLALRPDMTVAEVGAGKGRMMVRIAQRLGPSGHAFATELEPGELRAAVDRAGLNNVAVLTAGEHDSNLPELCCDAVFMSKVYHHLTDPQAMNASLFRALRPGGRLAIIDFEPSAWRFWLWRPAGVPENRGGHGMPQKLLIEELARAGFVLERAIADWWTFPERRYCVVMRKP